MKFLIGLVTLALTLAACPREFPPPDLRGDAGPEGCARACDVLRASACPEGSPSPGGVPCLAVCQNAPALLPVACVAAASSRDAVVACGVRCGS